MAERGLGHVRALDGVRGVAILLVIGRHYWHFPVGGGTAGVDLFFVLSGFLITTLLLEGRWPNLRAFYGARAKRLVPALAIVLAAYLGGRAISGHLLYGVEAVGVTGFYTANLVAAFWPHLPTTPIPLWSLALEEQFYLLWPLALVLLLRNRVRRRTVISGLLVLVFATCVYRGWLSLHGARNQRLYTAPDSHSDNLLIGIVLAYWRPYATDRALAAAATVLFALAAASGVGGEVITGPLVDIAGLGLIAYAATNESWLARTLSWRPLVWVGGISYSLYLWHLLTLSWVGERPLAISLAIVAAWASTRLIEEPFRRLRQIGGDTTTRPARAQAQSIVTESAQSAPLVNPT